MNRLKQLTSLLGKPLLDLSIVISGVTVAFLLNNWNMKKSERAEKEKILNSLQAELKEITRYFPSMEVYQQSKSKEWDSLLNRNQLSDFYQYYYLKPQYNYAIIEYAIETRNSEIVSFELYEKLLILYKHIKMLEQAETYMTDVALAYQSTQKGESITFQNLFLYKRFIGFSKNRANSLRAVNKVANDILTWIEYEKNQ